MVDVVKDRRTLEPLLPDMDSMKSSPFGEELSAFQLSAVQKEFFLNAISDTRADLRDASPEEQEEAIRKRILDVQKENDYLSFSPDRLINLP